MSRRALTALLSLAGLAALALALSVALTSSSGGGGTRAPAAGTAAPGSAAADSPSASGFDGGALPADVPAHPFTLLDQRGARVSLASLRGQVVVLAFLYSTCGPACVLVAQQIRGALDELERPPAVVLVSADPRADTRASVARFLAQTSLSGRVDYLSGAPAALAALARSYGVRTESSGRQAFDASLSVYLIDPRGRLRVAFSVEQLTPEALAHDIRRLQAGL